ncbi:MAG TPA: hypothetical protein VMQ76_12700 [Terracidiphilus sp.]|nr:hypothetical protein [Terracidiphilus sp.]
MTERSENLRIDIDIRQSGRADGHAGKRDRGDADIANPGDTTM